MNNLSTLLEILTPKQKRKTIILSFLLLLISLFELIFLHSIFLIMNLVSKNETNVDFYFFDLINSNRDIVDNTTLALYIFFIFFFFKTILNILVLKYESNYLYKTREELSNEFFLKYLNLPKLLHVKISIANLLKKIIIQVDNLTVAIRSLSTIFLEICVLTLISIYLFFTNIYLAIFILVIFIIFSLILLELNRNLIIEAGKEQVQHNEMRVKIVNELLSSLKLFRDLKFKDNGIKKYLFHNKKVNDISIMIALKNNYIRPIFELLIFFIIISSIIFIMIKSYQIKDFIAEFTVFLAASYRVMPSYVRVLSSYQSYKFNIQSIREYYEDKKYLFNNANNENTIKQKKINFLDFILLKNISFYYSKEKKILDDINFKINKGDKIVITGESGKGKTTLLEILMGLAKPSSGKILVDAKEEDLSNLSWQEKIGYVPQNIFISQDTLKKNIGFGYEDNEISITRVKECIDFSNLNNFVNLLENGLNTNLKDLGSNISGGQKQRIGIARALYNNPEILILDEPTSNLDEKNEKEIIQKLLNLKNVTLIVTSHKKDLLSNFDYIFNLENNSFIKKNEH